MIQAESTPFDILEALDQRGRQRAVVLPTSEEVRQQWTGIGFRLGGRNLVANLDEVAEVLTCPPLLQIPHTQSWVKGLANVRGNLLPVMDLNAFLGYRPVFMTSFTRVMVIQQGGIYAGLLVDEVLGMRHFFAEERGAVPADVGDALEAFVSGVFIRDGSTWLMFSMRSLAAAPEFLRVAA